MAFDRERKHWAGTPVLQGILRISLMVDLYLFLTAILIEIIFKVPIFSASKDEAFPFIILTATIILMLNYFIYGYNKRYTSIIEKYKSEDARTRKKNRLTVNLFIVFSVILLIVMFIIGVNQ